MDLNRRHDPMPVGATEIASHRGGARLWPENSLTAFRNTARLPVEQVEFDLHLTEDGYLVVHHDPTLERMTDGEGAISEHSLEALGAYTITGTEGEPIPSFADVLAVFQPTDLTMRIEIKADRHMRLYPGIEAKMLATLGEAQMVARTVITSFLIGALREFAKVETAIPLLWLVNPLVFRHIGGMEQVLDIAEQHQVGEIALHIDDLSASEMERATARRVRLGAYAVHEPEQIRKALDIGASTFTTDRPDLALRIRGENV